MPENSGAIAGVNSDSPYLPNHPESEDEVQSVGLYSEILRQLAQETGSR